MCCAAFSQLPFHLKTARPNFNPNVQFLEQWESWRRRGRRRRIKEPKNICLKPQETKTWAESSRQGEGWCDGRAAVREAEREHLLRLFSISWGAQVASAGCRSGPVTHKSSDLQERKEEQDDTEKQKRMCAPTEHLQQTDGNRNQLRLVYTAGKQQIYESVCPGR